MWTEPTEGTTVCFRIRESFLTLAMRRSGASKKISCLSCPFIFASKTERNKHSFQVHCPKATIFLDGSNCTCGSRNLTSLAYLIRLSTDHIDIERDKYVKFDYPFADCPSSIKEHRSLYRTYDSQP